MAARSLRHHAYATASIFGAFLTVAGFVAFILVGLAVTHHPDRPNEENWSGIEFWIVGFGVLPVVLLLTAMWMTVATTYSWADLLPRVFVALAVVVVLAAKGWIVALWVEPIAWATELLISIVAVFRSRPSAGASEGRDLQSESYQSHRKLFLLAFVLPMVAIWGAVMLFTISIWRV